MVIYSYNTINNHQYIINGIWLLMVINMVIYGYQWYILYGYIITNGIFMVINGDYIIWYYIWNSYGINSY